MPIGDPRDGSFYPTLQLMIYSYNLIWVRTTLSAKIVSRGQKLQERDKK